MFFPATEILFFNPLFPKEKRIYMFYYKTFSVRMLHLSFFIKTKFILLSQNLLIITGNAETHLDQPQI